MAHTFDKEAAALEAIRKRIEDEWRRFNAHHRDLVKRGDVEGAREWAGRVHDIMDPLHHERDRIIESMPPFTTWNEAGFLERHPVTPENAHLFK